MNQNTSSDSNSRTFDKFIEEVRDALSGKSRDKGYAQGPDGPNPLFEMTGPEHACGEIMYKAIRYRRKRNEEDVVKAAAWAFLLWRYHVPVEGVKDTARLVTELADKRSER